MERERDQPRLKAGYNVWFGLQHVTLTGFRHGGRRENCIRCNPALTPGSTTEPPAPDVEPGDEAVRG